LHDETSPTQRANSHIALRIGVSVGTVRAWPDQFAEERLATSGQVRRGVREPSISEEQLAQIVELTLHS
jgi:transposase